MKRQLFVRKGVSIISLIGLFCVSLFTFCAKENPTTPEAYNPTYSFSGFIIDGNTGKALGGAMVTYFKSNGDSVVLKTGSDGGFDIPGIPYGNRSFFFKYTPAGATAIQYTTAAITIEGNDWEHFGYKEVIAGVADSTSVVGGIRSVAGPVKLYPLSGSLSGTVITQLHDRAALNPIKNAVVKVTFDPTFNLDNQDDSTAAIGSNIEVGPSAFEVLTDSTGKFAFTGLPVSGDGHEKVTIKVVSVTSGGIDWEMTDSNGMEVELAANQSVPVGAIILNPIEKIELKVLDYNFKLGVVNPEHTFEATFSDELDTVSYTILSYTAAGAKINVPAVVTIAGKKITVNPVTSLISDVAYSLAVYAYGKAGQEVDTILTATVKGGGLGDVVSSNILTSAKAPVYNFGLKTPVTFTFADSITGISNVQISGVEFLAITSIDGKTLTITPRTIWKQSTININVTLRNGTIVSFSTPLNVENPLAFVSSNVYDYNANSSKNLVSLSSDIVFFTNKDLTTADVVFTEDGTSLPATVSLGEGDLKKVVINPLNALKPATEYRVLIVVGNAQGETKSDTVFFTTTATQFYAVSDNVRLNNDPNMARTDFAPNANIVIRMNKNAMNATASLTAGGTAVAVKVTIKNDSIIIDPEEILDEAKTYTLSVTAQDSAGLITDAQAYVKNLKPRASVYVMASNIKTADGKLVTNAAKDVTPWFKLSAAPAAAKIKAIITKPSVDAVVSVNGDTLFVNPVSDFKYGDTVAISITGEAVDGNYISITDSFYVMKKPVISLVASNVVNSNYEGLTGIAENVELWYKLSRAPSVSTVSGTINGINNKAVVRVSGDTVFLKATENLPNGTVIPVTFTGLDSSGISFSFASTADATPGTSVAWKSFKVREALFPVASNTWGPMGKGDNATNFTFYDTMWVKFSQPLSTDLSKIEWSTPAGFVVGTDVAITADPTTQPNSVVWVSGDTLFVLPDNRANITWNKKVGFSVKVKTALGQATAVYYDFVVKTPELNLFVKSTNTKDAFGERRDDFGLRDSVFVVSSVPIDSIHDVYSLHSTLPATDTVVLPDEAAGTLKSSVTLRGDTIVYKPSAKLTSDATYAIDFKVHLKNEPVSVLRDHVLGISWKTKAGVLISATNVMANATTFRPFKVIGDTLSVTFTKAIDTSYNAPTPFKINGFVDNITKIWSSDLKTVRIINRDTLTARAYSIAQNDMTTNNNTWDYPITFNVTCADGEEKSGLGGENRFIGKMAIKTEYKCAIVAANFVEGHTTVSAIANTETAKDTFAITGNPTLVFSRAIASSKLTADAINQYQSYIVLRKNGSTVPLEFALTISADAKTLTLDPVLSFEYNTEYEIDVMNIPVTGLKETVSGPGTNSILTTYDFKTIPRADVNISALATVIAVDTRTSPSGYAEDRYGYSPFLNSGTNNASKYTNQENPGVFKIKIAKPAWGATYRDNVDGFQFRVRRSTGASAWTDWYILPQNEQSAGSDYNPLDVNVNGTSMYSSVTVDLSLEDADLYNALKVADGDGTTGLSNYFNGDNVLNGGTIVQFEGRAFFENTQGSSTRSYGAWSTTPISFADNVAPGDTDFTGAVSLSTVNMTLAPWSRLVAPNNTADSSNYITITFNEDMDMSTVPNITFFSGTSVTPGMPLPRKALNSRWVNARTYELHVEITNGYDYSNATGPEKWYYRVNVNGMKDYSGVTLINSGNVGSTTPGANGTAFGTLSGVTAGNVAIGLGYYLIP